MNELKRKSHQLLQDLELFHLKQADNKANKYLQITKQVTTGQSATWDIRIPHQVQVLPFQILASAPEKATDDVSSTWIPAHHHSQPQVGNLGGCLGLGLVFKG